MWHVAVKFAQKFIRNQFVQSREFYGRFSRADFFGKTP